MLAKTDARARIQDRLRPTADLFVRVFFVTIGAKVELGVFSPTQARHGTPALLLAAIVVGKLLAGAAGDRRGVPRLPVGVGMVPRGEVGLIFARLGFSSGLGGPELYSAWSPWSCSPRSSPPSGCAPSLGT